MQYSIKSYKPHNKKYYRMIEIKFIAQIVNFFFLINYTKFFTILN